MSGAAVCSARSLSAPRLTTRAGAVLLLFFVVVGWATPAHAQALQLNIGTFNGQIGFNSFTLQATGGTAPYHYALVGLPVPGFRVQDGAPLPTNITIQPSGTGAFLGVATTSGVFTTTIRVTDAVLTQVDRAVTLNIPRVLFTGLPPKATKDAPYSFTPVPYGGTALHVVGDRHAGRACRSTAARARFPAPRPSRARSTQTSP